MQGFSMVLLGIFHTRLTTLELPSEHRFVASALSASSLISSVSRNVFLLGDSPHAVATALTSKLGKLSNY